MTVASLGIEPMGRLRAFFDLPIRHFWITLLVPTLFSLKYAFGDFDPWPDDSWNPTHRKALEENRRATPRAKTTTIPRGALNY